MATIDYTYTHGDENHKNAVNYDGRNYYHNPMTVLVNDVLFIVPFGTSDRIYDKERDNQLIIVNENERLDYIGMVIIDTTDNSIVECFLQGNDINDVDSPANGIFNLELDEQIRVLENYLPY